MNHLLNELFQRDLTTLKSEIAAYQEENDLWLKPEGINNSAGNLALHLIGNLNHFIGAVLGDTGYIRNREAEFGDRNIPQSSIMEDIDKTATMIDEVLAKLSAADLDKTYPIEVFGEPINTRKFLVHLQGHLNYHLGQVNYHRRLLTDY